MYEVTIAINRIAEEFVFSFHNDSGSFNSDSNVSSLFTMYYRLVAIGVTMSLFSNLSRYLRS
jgi:hypothetical protein